MYTSESLADRPFPAWLVTGRAAGSSLAVRGVVSLGGANPRRSLDQLLRLLGALDFGGERGGGRRAGDDAEQPPVLHLRQRAGLHDLDHVALVRIVVLVVNVADGPALDVLAV